MLKPRNLLILHSDRKRENATKAELRYTPGTRKLLSLIGWTQIEINLIFPLVR